MSLDVYVMPLWRFKAGHFQTAVEQLTDGHSRLITPDGIIGIRQVKKYFARRRAKPLVSRILTEAQEQLGIQLDWHDEGGTVHAMQASWGFAALRAYAKWLDLRDVLPKFEEPSKGNYYEHPALLWNEQDRPYRFSQITKHSCYGGYFVPCQFDRVVYVEPHQWFGGPTLYNSFGSTYALIDQLRELGQHMPPAVGSDVSDAAKELIQIGYDTLNELSAKSIAHSLPIIFYG